MASTSRLRGRVLVLGSGSVSRCLQVLLMRERAFEPDRTTVLDQRSLDDLDAPLVDGGARFVRHRLTPDNLAATLAQHLAAGDLLVNLTCSVSSAELIAWCHDHGVLYIDTSVEVWDPAGRDLGPPAEQTLYHRHLELRSAAARRPDGSPTAIVEHGANPGLVNHWVKRGLLEIGGELIDGPHAVDERRVARLRDAIDAQDFARLAMETGTRVIQISERDTQVSTRPKEVGEFVNTWSVDGFHEEGVAPAELGWGTHERRLPRFGREHADGLGSPIYLEQAGIDTYVRSWVPLGGPIIGMVVRHGEAFTISDHLTVRVDGEPVYRPTVYYAYLPADAAIASLHELRMSRYELQPRQRIMADDIVSGIDELGVLMLGHDLGGWWVGSQLGIDESRALAPGQNATTLQVAASVLGAMAWIVEHPDRGLCVPDDLDHRFVLDRAGPYLGPCPSVRTGWTPLDDSGEPFAGDRDVDDDDPSWQFHSFAFPRATAVPEHAATLAA